MTYVMILLASLVVHAADAGKTADLSNEEILLAASDEEAAALLAEEFGHGKGKAEDQEVVKITDQSIEKGQVSEAKVNLHESQIPVLTETKKPREESSPQPFRKMVISLGVILAAIFGIAYAGRRWFINKKTSTPSTTIKIISQHYLGPRKSLAIVYVAGESLLVGITDQQINLVKQLSLIDDEIPGDLPKKFDETLDFAESVQPETGENFSMRGLKDLVSNRLKNMREI